MTKFVISASLAALAAVTPAVAPAQKVGGAIIVVVDRERVYGECTACKAAQAQLQSQVTALQQRAQQLGQPLQNEGQALETAVRTLNGKQPDPALQQRIKNFQTQQNTANQEIQNKQQNLQSIQVHVAQQIDQRLNPIINQVMTARGANVAVDSDQVLAHARALDVTDDVLAQLNQQLPSVSVTPMPQPQQPAAQAPVQGR